MISLGKLHSDLLSANPILLKMLSVIQSVTQFSRSVVSDSLRPHESQHARPPCPSSAPGDYSNTYPGDYSNSYPSSQ